MRRIVYGLTILAVGLGVTLLAKERRASDEGAPVGAASRALMAEHEVILRVLGAVQAEADHVRRGFSMDKGRVRDILDFSRNFIESCHHGKEERFYFPALKVYAGPRVYGFIDELTAEHAYGRSILDEIEYLIRNDDGEVDKWIGERLSIYAAMLARHIRKENERLYQKAGALLASMEEQALMIGFERVEQLDLGVGFHERYYKLAEDLTSPLLGVK